MPQAYKRLFIIIIIHLQKVKKLIYSLKTPNEMIIRLTSMYMRMRTMAQKYVLSASLTNRGANTTHQEVESGRPLSTLNVECNFFRKVYF